MLELLVRSAKPGSDLSSAFQSLGDHDGGVVLNDGDRTNMRTEQATQTDAAQRLEFEIYTDPEDANGQQSQSAERPREKSDTNPAASPIGDSISAQVASPAASMPPTPPQKFEAPLPPLPPLPAEHLASCVKPTALTRARPGVDAPHSVRLINTSSGGKGDNAPVHAQKSRGYSTQTLQTIQVYMDEDVLC
jgi:hypothetical protein